MFQRLTNINLSVDDFQTSAWSNCRQTQELLEPRMCLTMPGKKQSQKGRPGDCWARKKAVSVIHSLSFNFGSKRKERKINQDWDLGS